MRTFCTLMMLGALLTGCSMNPSTTAGGTTDTGNAIVAGTVVDSLGNPVSGALVTLLPSTYNPVPEDPSRMADDTTDSAGQYRFVFPDSTFGTFTVSAYHQVSGTRLLITNIKVSNDTVDVGEGTMTKVGAIQIALSQINSVANGYLYIPGTNIYVKVDQEKIYTVNGIEYFIFDSLPSNVRLDILYAEAGSSLDPVSLMVPFTVFPDQTISLSFTESWDSLTTDNGLPENTLLSVIVDNEGMLWIGTQSSGLVTWDGTACTEYNTSNSALPNDTVQALAQDRDGSIWVGTAEGVVCIADTGWTVYTEDNSAMANNVINDIAVDSAGNVHFASAEGILVKTDSSWQHLVLVGGIPLTIVYSIAFDKDGNALIGTNNGLFVQTTTWKHIPVLGISANTLVYDIAVDKQNAQWLATPRGIIRYYDEQWKVYNTTSGLPTNNFKCVTVDGNDVVWAGAFSGGVVAKLEEEPVIYSGTDTPALAGAGTINAVTNDNHNSMYFATKNKGLVRLTFIIEQ